MSNVNLTQAFSQWANRPDDERFSSLDELVAHLDDRDRNARTATVNFGGLRVCPINTEEGVNRGLALNGETGVKAGLTDWSMTQLCARVHGNKDMLSRLPMENVVSDVNHLIRIADEDKESKLLLDLRGGSDAPMVRAFTSNIYGRLWDSAVAKECRNLRDDGWRTPPARPAHDGQPGTRPATEADVLINQRGGLSISIGDLIAPAGLYASDRDLFVFMINEQYMVDDGGKGLSRGFFCENSEVGKSKIKWTTFLFDKVCGNHIVWGARDVKRISARHVGDKATEAFGEMKVKLVQYVQSSENDDKLRVRRAMEHVIATTKEDVIKAVFKEIRELPHRTIEKAYDRVVDDARFDPKTAWGLASGLTTMSQDSSFASQRVTTDAAAGKVLEMAF